MIAISLVQAGKTSPRSLSTFHPEFTYPLFGDEQRIFGFQDLTIAIRFAAHDLRSNVRITYEKKFKPVGDTKATDIVNVLKDFLPPGKHLQVIQRHIIAILNFRIYSRI